MKRTAKNILLIFLVLAMVFGICACGNVAYIVDDQDEIELPVIVDDTQNTDDNATDDYTSDESIPDNDISDESIPDIDIPEDSIPDKSIPNNDISEDEDTENESDYVDYYFRNAKLLNQHYEKHGIEMGFSSAEEYEKAASDVVNNPEALHKTEAEDGDFVYYVESTNEFVVLSKDGYLRTYFLPNAGKRYYDKQ